jgi:hypothetical protein
MEFSLVHICSSLAPDLNPTDEELKELIDEVDKSGDTKLVLAPSRLRVPHLHHA